jgi:hypothetical protein
VQKGTEEKLRNEDVIYSNEEPQKQDEVIPISNTTKGDLIKVLVRDIIFIY